MGTAFVHPKHRPGYRRPVSGVDSHPQTLNLAIPTSRNCRHAAGTSPIPAERRTDLRYQLHLDFDVYSMREGQFVWLGMGRTINWSRITILIRCDRPLMIGKCLQLAVRWSPGVQLVVVAEVIRSEPRGVVVRMLRRRFRGRPTLA
jgi:hypothetical protein